MRKMLLSLMLLVALVPVALAQDTAQNDCGGEFDLPIWQVEADDCQFQQAVTMTVDVSYPDALNDYAFAKQAMLDYLNQRQAEFWTTMSGGYFGPEGAGMSLDIGYEEYHFALSVVTVVFNGYSYTGGAHGNDFTGTFTFDLANEQVLTLDDLFIATPAALKAIFPLVKADLQAKLTDFDDEAWLTEGTGENPANYQNFAITDELLIFFFPSYQVAPYVYGPQEVAIPLDALKDVLAFRFAPQD